MAEDPLKACPFCGGDALSVEHTDEEEDEKLVYWVECEGCRTEGPVAPNAQSAIELWNTADGRQEK